MWTTLDGFEPSFAYLFRSVYMMAYIDYEFLLPRHHRHNVPDLSDNAERFVQHKPKDLYTYRTQKTVKQI